MQTNDKLKEGLNKSFDRSVDMNLARPLKAGKAERDMPRRVATAEIEAEFNHRYATGTANNLIPALKRRAKFIPTLRVENT